MTADQSSASTLLARLFWIMIGPMILMVLAIQIVTFGNGWLTRFDVAFFVILASLVAARWIEFRTGHPETGTGEPATWSHFRRYTAGVLGFGLAVWAVANLFGNHWLVD
jgi:hypothetical protein